MSTAKNSQIDLFKMAASDVEADQSDGALDRAMGMLDLRKKPEKKEPKLKGIGRNQI